MTDLVLSTYLAKGWIDVNTKLPEPGVPVQGVLRGCGTRRIVEALLIHVEESDCTWRTADDFSEIDFSFDVICWFQ